jgi:ribose/xylose/arabinose/galactoside ABC-type transport system permease subunit
MKPTYKILLIGILAIVLLDSLGSIASKQLGFNYTSLASISFIIYAMVGFFTTKQKDLKTGVLFAAATGLFDSTIGWKIIMMLGVNTSIKITPFLWFITIIFVTGLAALCGLIGGWLTRFVKRSE